MRTEKVMNTKNAVLALLLFGSVSAYAQNTVVETDSTNTSAHVQTTKEVNPAIEQLKKQLEANPNDTQALVKLATAYQEAKDWNNAISIWNKTSELLPDWAPSYYSLGYVYQSMKDNANAKTAYEKYIAMVKPAEIEANKQNLAYAHLFVAFALQETDKAQAKQHIAKSLEYDPSNEDAIKLNKFLNQ